LKPSYLNRFLNVLLLGGFVISLAFTTWNIVQFSRSWSGSLLIDLSEAELSRALARLAVNGTSSGQIEKKLAEALDAVPRDWVVIDSLEEIASTRGDSLSPQLAQKLETARAEDHSLQQQALSCAKCAWDVALCDGLDILTCRLPIELTSVGDLQGVWQAGDAYIRGEEIDKVDATLSVVGLGATAMTVASLGAGSPATLPVKVGASTIKLVRNAGKLPLWMQRELLTAATKGINWKMLSQVRSIGGLKMAISGPALQPAIDSAKHVGSTLSQAGPAQTVYILENTSNALELRKIASVSKTYKNQTVGYLKVVGKSKLVRATMRYSDEVYGMVVGLIGVVTSLALSFVTGGLNVARRRLRRVLSASNKS
jgi:hypothetical protein